MRFFVSSLFLLLFFLVPKLDYSKSYFNAPGDTTVNVVISLKSDKENIISAVKQRIKNNPSVHSVVYCQNHSVFLITIDRSAIIIRDDFFNYVISPFPDEDIAFKGEENDLRSFCSFSQEDGSDIKTKKQ